MDTPFLTETLDLAAQVADRTEQVETYLDQQNIPALWAQAVRDAQTEAGYTERSTFFNAPYAQHRISYDLDLSGGTLHFSGTDFDGDFHSYDIPADFVFEETRPAAVARLVEEYRDRAARQRAKDEQRAKEQRARDEAEYARLRQALGKTD